MVVHHQDPAAFSGGVCCQGRNFRLFGRVGGERQPDGEGAALARARALGSDGPAVHFREPPDERKADAEASLRAVEAAPDLGEEIEDFGEHFPRNPDSRVRDAHDDLRAIGVGGELDAPAVGGVFSGVVDQIAD